MRFYKYGASLWWFSASGIPQRLMRLAVDVLSKAYEFSAGGGRSDKGAHAASIGTALPDVATLPPSLIRLTKLPLCVSKVG